MSLFAIDLGRKSEMVDTVQINKELKEVTLIVANQHQYMLIKFVNIACYIFMKLKIWLKNLFNIVRHLQGIWFGTEQYFNT